jgi:polygalacturonase
MTVLKQFNDATDAWVPILAGDANTVFNVRDYGAVGDGVTDDTAAIQAAVTAASAVAGVVIIPLGEFLIAPDTITLSSPVTVEGAPGSELTLATAGTAFSIASDDVTLKGLTLTTASDASVLAVADAQDRTTITGCNLNEARLIKLNASQTWGPASATGDSKDITLTGNTMRCTTSTAPSESAMDLRFVFGGNISGNRIDGYPVGITWWGGGADPISGPWPDGAIANARKCGSLTISDNHVTNIGGPGIWGSMGRDITITGNIVKTCGDVCIDVEGGLDVTVTGNTARDGVNGAITTFFLNRGVTISGNTCSTSIANGRVIWAYLANNQEDNRDIVVSGNTISAYGTIGVCGGDAAASIVVSGNTCRNVKLSYAGNYFKTVTVADNMLSFDVVAGAAFSAIEASHNFVNARVRISGNNIRSTAVQPAGSIGIYSLQDDFNSNPTTVIESNMISDFPVDIKVEADSAHSGRVPVFLVRNNVVASSTITRTEGTASASESVTFLEGNRDLAGAHVPAAQPVAGRWDRGQIIYSNAPTGSTYGWICTATGVPGTWSALNT